MLEQSLSDVDSAAAAPVTDDDLKGVNKAGRENTVDGVGQSLHGVCVLKISVSGGIIQV